MEKQIRTIQLIHLALLAGIIAAYFFIGDMFNFLVPKLEGENLYYMFIPAIAVLLSNFIFKNAIAKINTKESKDKILLSYQTASMIRWMILEAGAFLILILKPELILFGLLLVFYLLLVKPTKEKIENELGIRL